MNVNINPTVTGIGEYLKKYVDQGFKVFPCKLSDIPEKNKSPASINGFKDATDSIDTFYTLKENYSAITKQVIPDDKLLIGLATGNVNGIVVIDFDINKKIPGTKNIDPRTVDELIEEVEENYGPLPDTFTVETKSGGRHFYYLLPDGVELSSGNRFLDRLLSVDIKANGGYVIAPSGESGYIVYDDVDDLGIDNLRERCAPLPEWIEFHQRTQQEITQQVLNETLSPEEIREIRSALTYLSSDDRNLWVDIGLALKNTGSPAAYGLWNEWSQTSEKYDASDMEKRWAGFKPKKITLGTLFFKAKNLGWDWPHDSTALNKYRGIYPQYFYGFDDNSHVERFTVQYGELYLFDTRKDKDCWRLFDGARYDGIHRNYFEETVNQVFKNIKQEKQFALDFAKEKYEKDEDREKFMGSFYALYTKVKNNNVKSAGKQIELALSRDDFDENNGNLINCKNVTLHVDSSGNVTQIADRETRQRLKLTRVFDVVYDVDAECPKFIKFIRQLFPSDTLVFIQMFLGHCLIDVIKSKNRIFLVVEGAPGTGKTTLFNVLAVLFGDYACPAIEGLFATAPNPDMKKANPGFIATLNKRLVYLPEIEKESILSASNIKRMTGGDNIAERALYADVQEYSGREDNTARVVMYCNLTPRIDCVDDAIEERVKIVPCLPAINEEDRIYNLEDELLNERSGILNWLLTGLKSYIQNDYDFEYPQSVRIKTDEWLSMHDNVKRGTTYFETFYETELISDINGKVKITDLADYYAKKCIDNGYTKDAGNDKKFHDLMESHGHEKFKTGGILVYKGLRCPNLE